MHGLYSYEMWCPAAYSITSAQINKAHNPNAFFCINFQVSQLLTNSHNLQHEITRNSLLILYIFNVLPMTY